MNKEEKIEMYKKAEQSTEILKKAGGKVSMRMSIPDRAYFTIQKLLQNKDKTPIKALNPGKVAKNTAHQAFVEQYAVTRDGTEEQKAQETMQEKQKEQVQETEALAK